MDPSDKVCHGSYGFRFAQKNVIKFGNFLGVADFYGLEILKLFLQISYEQSHAVLSLWVRGRIFLVSSFPCIFYFRKPRIQLC